MNMCALNINPLIHLVPHTDVTAQVDVLEMVSKQKRALELSLQTINSLNSQALTFPEVRTWSMTACPICPYGVTYEEQM